MSTFYSHLSRKSMTLSTCDAIDELYFFCFLIASYLAFFASATLFISVITLIRRRILKRPTNFISAPITWNTNEIITTIESKTLMNSIKKMCAYPKSFKQISITKNVNKK